MAHCGSIILATIWAFVGIAVAGCRSASEPGGCPASAPATGSSCEGNLQCDYGDYSDCADGQRVTQEHVCIDGTWALLNHGSCTSPCPETPAVIGERCATDRVCSYNESASCPGGGSVSYTHVCQDGFWTVRESDACDPGPCPDAAPPLGASCSTPMYCDYDERMDCVDGGTIRHIRVCEGGVWTGHWSGDCETKCGASPAEGTPCHGYLECYESHGDCVELGGIEFWNVCDNGVWRRETRGSCEEDPCPQYPPTVGDVCDESADCAYDQKMDCVGGGTTLLTYQCDGERWNVSWHNACETACPKFDRPEVGSFCTGDLSCYFGDHIECDMPFTQGVFHLFLCDGTKWTEQWQGSCVPACPDTPPEPSTLCSPTGMDCYYDQHIPCPGFNGGTELHHICENWTWSQEWQGSCSDAGAGDGGDP